MYEDQYAIPGQNGESQAGDKKISEKEGGLL
jgi:hypothetical protein